MDAKGHEGDRALWMASGCMEAIDSRKRLLEWSFGEKGVGRGVEGYAAFA